MAIVDYTTFVETDPGSDITVTAEKIEAVNLVGNSVSNIKYDGGYMGYKVPFTYRTPVVIKSYSTEDSYTLVWGLANSDITSISMGFDIYDITGVALWIDLSNDLYSFYLLNWNQTTGSNELQGNWHGIDVENLPLTLYLNIEISNSTMTLGVYDSSAYSNLVEEISLENVHDESFQYIFGLMSYGSPAPESYVTMDIGPLTVVDKRLNKRGFPITYLF